MKFKHLNDNRLSLRTLVVCTIITRREYFSNNKYQIYLYIYPVPDRKVKIVEKVRGSKRLLA